MGEAGAGVRTITQKESPPRRRPQGRETGTRNHARPVTATSTALRPCPAPWASPRTHSHVLADVGTSRSLAYVGLTRGKETNRLYVEVVDAQPMAEVLG